MPRFHLKGFASEKRQLRQIDLTTGRQALVSIDDASVVKDFYTVTSSDGSPSDKWEQRLAELETLVAPIVRRAASSEYWSVRDRDREYMAAWIALQYLRGTDHRRLIESIRAMEVQMQVGMGGLEYLQHAMAQGLGRHVEREAALLVWSDITTQGGPTIKIDGDEHIASIASSMPEVTSIITSRSWHRSRFTRHELAINDSPVALIPDDGHPEYMGVGLSNAGAITVALDRRTLLWLGDPGMPEIEMPASTLLARSHNHSVVFGADRFVYLHPDGQDPTAGLPLPRPVRRAIHGSNLEQFANIDRPLEDTLRQIQEHDADPRSLIANYTWPMSGYIAPDALATLL